MPAIHPKKERQRIWRDKGDRRRVHARPAGSRCRFAKNRVYRRNLCCIPRATNTGAVKECASRSKSPVISAVTACRLAFRSANAYLSVRIPAGKQNALEEASKTDSIPSVEARQRSKPCQGISGFKGRAADSAMLERHAGQDCSLSSTAGHETIPCRSLSQTGI